jgi:hypothetical protein
MMPFAGGGMGGWIIQSAKSLCILPSVHQLLFWHWTFVIGMKSIQAMIVLIKALLLPTTDIFQS